MFFDKPAHVCGQEVRKQMIDTQYIITTKLEKQFVIRKKKKSGLALQRHRKNAKIVKEGMTWHTQQHQI